MGRILSTWILTLNVLLTWPVLANECEDLLGGLALDAVPAIIERKDLIKSLNAEHTIKDIDIFAIRPEGARAFKKMFGTEPTAAQRRAIEEQIRILKRMVPEAVVIGSETTTSASLAGAIAASKADLIIVIAHNENGEIILPNGTRVPLARLVMAAARSSKALLLETCRARCYLPVLGHAEKDITFKDAVRLAASIENTARKIAFRGMGDVLYSAGQFRAATKPDLYNAIDPVLRWLAKAKSLMALLDISGLESYLVKVEWLYWTRPVGCVFHTLNGDSVEFWKTSGTWGNCND